MDATIRPCGEQALLVQVTELSDVLALYRVLAPLLQRRQGAWVAVVDLVPAARTLLVTVADPGALAGVRAHLEEAMAAFDVRDVGADDAPTVTVPVVYDGPDLADVAAATGLSETQVVAAHTGTLWRVAFGGFAPGFSYLVDGDPRLQVARRVEPRTSVPAGAVGLAGVFSGVYPRSSPGGWQLIGHTDTPMWDLDRDPPALLLPGHAVRFVDAGTGPSCAR